MLYNCLSILERKDGTRQFASNLESVKCRNISFEALIKYIKEYLHGIFGCFNCVTTDDSMKCVIYRKTFLFDKKSTSVLQLGQGKESQDPCKNLQNSFEKTASLGQSQGNCSGRN